LSGIATVSMLSMAILDVEILVEQVNKLGDKVQLWRTPLNTGRQKITDFSAYNTTVMTCNFVPF